MWEGMVFSFVRKWLANINEWLKKPIFDCAICQTPYYGSLFYWIIWGNDWKEWLIVVFSAMGLITIFVRLFPIEPEN